MTKEAEDEGVDVFVKGDNDDNADTRSTKRSGSSTISYNNLASNSNVSVSELQDGQHDSAQSLQPGPAVASLQQLDLTNDHLPKHLRRRGATRNTHRKRPRITTPIGLATTASTVSAVLESADLEAAQSRALATAPDQERELRNIDLEIVDNRSTDDLNDGDYADESDDAGSKIGGRPRFRKRVRQTKDKKDNDVVALFTYSLNVLYQATVATSSGSMQESEEIPIHGPLCVRL
ncbi:hypothetical protein G7Y89_g5046 [Cudoniella acicularis]|uniref:Uncharacterized protein n=1 Tax=Cudoniella acicularis TaxID=354080 RepID=A0A8H4RN80_9HELO|nr:hypothetical protein G7Y89_g5046 [Cudoniella acicularis]